MCIIWIKNKGLDLPKKEIIETMFNNNSHGGGFAYAENGEVVIKKGYMDFDSYYEALQQIPNIKDINLVGHCRIATHGTINQNNCHPFPLSNRISHLKATHIKCSIGIIHNGIISSVKEDKKNDLSDTMTYIKNVLYPRYRANNSFMDSEEIREEIKKEIKSKMVIMKSDGSYYLIGDFITEDGYIYSNYSYINYEYNFDNFDYNDKWEDDCYLDDDYVLLEDDDYIILDGVKVYGRDEYLFLTQNGVYIESGTYGEFCKVSDSAYSYKGEKINFKDRYMEEWGVAY